MSTVDPADFDALRQTLIGHIGALNAGRMDIFPARKQVEHLRAYVENLAIVVDAHLTEVCKEARYMTSAGVPKKVTALTDFLSDEGVLHAFDKAAKDFD